MAKINEFPVGTIVYKNSRMPLYAVVIDGSCWHDMAKKENPQMVKDFMSDAARIKLIPLFILGNILRQSFKTFKKGDNLFSKSVFLQRFDYSNVGVDVHALSGLPELWRTLRQAIDFFGGEVTGYHQSVNDDLKVLEPYLHGTQCIDSIFNNCLMEFFAKALPGLAGSLKKS